jgi:hypothetical protein
MTRADFHENYASEEVAPPAERLTGLVFAAVAVVVALLWRNSLTISWLALCTAVVVAAISLIAPSALKPLNIFWFKIGLFLHRLANPVVLFAIFALVFVPAGLILRFWRDPLRSRRMPSAASYWIDCTEDGGGRGSMADQF